MELGPKQKEWIQYLKDHPEKAGNRVGITGYLGMFSRETNEWLLCCLGATCMIAYEQANEEPKTIGNRGAFLLNPSDTSGDSGHLINFEDYGLRGSLGEFKEFPVFGEDEESFLSLAHMNDSGIPWIKIAEYMETHPENVFIRSV